MSIAQPLLRHELAMFKQRYCLYQHIYRRMSWMLLAVLTNDLIASFVRGLTVRLATAQAELCAPVCPMYTVATLSIVASL